MNEKIEYMDTHLKAPEVSSIDFAYINDEYHVELFLMTGKHIHIVEKTLAACEEEIMIGYMGYRPDGT